MNRVGASLSVMQGAFSDLEDLLDASHKLVEESVDSRARSQQASPSVTRDTSNYVSGKAIRCPGLSPALQQSGYLQSMHSNDFLFTFVTSV